MKVKFINPIKEIKNEETFWDYKTILALTQTKGTSPPLALPLLGAIVPSDVEVVLTDENIEEINYEEKVDLVGILGMTCMIDRSYEIADEFKKRGIPVMMGGIHVSMMPDEALQHCDTVVIGEAEEILEQVIRDAEQGNLQKIYRAPGFCDMTKVPIPRWDLINIKEFIYFVLQTGRGCPNNCEFCSVSNYHGLKYRHRMIEQVVKELKYLKKLDPKKAIVFIDDNILSIRRYARELFKAMIPLKLNSWICQASINKLDDDEMLDLMHEAGCSVVFIGFESVSQKSLEGMKKGHVNKPTEYKRIINKIYDHKINIFGSFIVGNDTDDEITFKDTAKFLEDANLLFPMLNILTPLPGTRLYEKIEKEKRIFTRKWSEYSGESLTFYPKLMSPKALKENYIKLLRGAYSYDQLFKKLNYLWLKGVDIEPKKYNYFRLNRLLLSIYAFTRREKERIKFLLKSLWSPKVPKIQIIVLALSFHDFAYSKFFK